MKTIRIISYLLGAGLTACSYHIQVLGSQQVIDSKLESSVEMDSLVAPFRRELVREFGKEIGQATSDLLTTRSSMTLGFWTCDALIDDARSQDRFQNEPLIAVFNYGGFRADISTGPITVGDIYKVMPFDNRLVYLKTSVDKLQEIVDYMQVKGGEPIGGFRIVKGKLDLPPTLDLSKGYVWVITSDFLAEGGDNMTFLSDPMQRVDTNILLRDFILEAVKKQQKISNTDSERITW